MIPSSRPFIGFEEFYNLANVLISGQLGAGFFVDRLEQKSKEILGVSHAIAVSNGTTALHLALIASGVGFGDEVITTPFTFIATANAILMTGATPVFVDISPDDYCIDPDCINRAVTQKTKAVLTVNLYGGVCDYDNIRTHTPDNVKIIEDAAQSFGAKYKGLNSGTLGDIATFSLYATKNVTSGEGGIVTTNDPFVADKIRRLRHHGMEKNKPYVYKELGYNYRISELNASVGVAQMNRLDAITSKRRAIAARYVQGVAGIIGVSPYLEKDECYYTYHQFPIRIGANAKTNRDDLQSKLRQKGIQTGIYYPSTLIKSDHISKNSVMHPCPNAEIATQELLCLPIYPGLAEDDQWYIIDVINQVLR
ncbi:MAG: DegT/DnrJ/EryC1/StrS family aminotransferase [Candidatus Levybacteria bacterium]|nr:DegT/DnrJ/EryC1/StrS family aminotransferase [Candidatus Levybacteria bacterium]